MNALSLETRTEIVRLILSGYSVRRTAEAVGSNKDTCSSLIARVGASCQAILTDRLRGTSVCHATLRRTAFVVHAAFTNVSKKEQRLVVAALIDDRSGAIASFGLGMAEADAMREARCAAERALGDSVVVSDMPSAHPPPAPSRVRLQAKDDAYIRNVLGIWFCYKNCCVASSVGRTPAQIAGAATEAWPLAKLVGLALGIAVDAPSAAMQHEPIEAASSADDRCVALGRRLVDGSIWTGLAGPHADRLRRLLEYALDLAVDGDALSNSALYADPSTDRHGASAEESRVGRAKMYEFDGEMLTLDQIAARTGKRVDFFRYHLRKGVSPSAAARGRYDKFIGAHFDRMEVLAVEGDPGHHRMCFCRCKCGAEKWASLKHLKSGGVTSCGCAHLEELSGGKAPTYVELLGERISIGQLAVLAGRKPVAIWARLRRGMTPEEAAFGMKERAPA